CATRKPSWRLRRAPARQSLPKPLVAGSPLRSGASPRCCAAAGGRSDDPGHPSPPPQRPQPLCPSALQADTYYVSIYQDTHHRRGLASGLCGEDRTLTDPERGCEELRGILSERIKLLPDASGQSLWAE